MRPNSTTPAAADAAADAVADDDGSTSAFTAPSQEEEGAFLCAFLAAVVFFDLFDFLIAVALLMAVVVFCACCAFGAFCAFCLRIFVLLFFKGLARCFLSRFLLLTSSTCDGVEATITCAGILVVVVLESLVAVAVAVLFPFKVLFLYSLRLLRVFSLSCFILRTTITMAMTKTGMMKPKTANGKWQMSRFMLSLIFRNDYRKFICPCLENGRISPDWS